MDQDLMIVMAVNVGSLITGVVYLSRRVTNLERKINNGLAERTARIEERIEMLWDHCPVNTATKTQ